MADVNHPRRGIRSVCVLLAAVVVGAAGVLCASAAPSGAAAPIVTYQANTSQSGALVNSYPATPKSDGWAVALSRTQVFNVTHHIPTLEVTCHNQVNGSVCWPNQITKTVTSGSLNFVTSVAPGLYFDQASGHLFVWAVETDGIAADNRAGVVCVDTTQPVSATGAQLFCGFTPLSAKGDAIGGLTATITAPVMVGSNWYAFNTLAGATGGAGGGTENTLLCFSTATLAPCASPASPSALIPLDGTVSSAVGLGASGSDVFLPVAETVGGTLVDELTCFDTSTHAGCTGSWPKNVNGLGGSPFPLLSSTGVPLGICNSFTQNRCYDFTGTRLTTPANMTKAIGATGFPNGPAIVLGTSVYLANYVTGSINCYNYATLASCGGYPRAMPNMVGVYTVNSDPFRPTCIWVNSDHGNGQIENFDAVTGGACAHGPYRLNASSLISQSPGCQPTAAQASTFQSLQITSPARTTYANASVQFADARGIVDSAIPTQTVNNFGIADLSHLNFSSDLSPQFVITFQGLSTAPAVVGLRLTWNAPYGASCLTGGQSVSNTPGYWMSASDGGIFNYGNAGFFGSTGSIALNKPIVGMAAAPNRGGYWLAASDGGIFAFGSSAFYGSAGSLHLNKPVVGMAATPDGHGYWMVASDGGIFNYGDAQFYGSAGSLPLNKPIVGMASTSDGGGYWLVASDGGIFSYGDAQFYGSTGNLVLNKPVVGIAANPKGGGYWMVASDGGIFNYGTSNFFGSSGSLVLNKPIVGMAPTFDGNGYWLAASDGGIFSYGDATFAGSTGNLVLNKPVVAISS